MNEQNEMPSHHGAEESVDRDYPNETLRLLIERASCRSFEDKPIPENVMQLVLEAGIHAATGGNLQPYSIIRIENQANKTKLAELCGHQLFIATAPVDLLFCIDLHRLQRWAEIEVAPFTATSAFRHFWISFQDTIICAQNICTAADALGLGSVYIGTVTECFREIRQMFELPDGVFPVVLLCLGYPRMRPLPRKKLGVEVIVYRDRYREIEEQTLVDAFDRKYPDLKVQITDERLETIAKVCREAHSEEFAERCIAKIKENGYIRPVQRYFGLHYMANLMPQDNDKFLQLMEEFGFGWFKKHQPPENDSAL
jgi:FMN reductase [NAD(P)H]